MAKQTIEIGDRVELKPGFDAVYTKALPGAVATITAKKVDEGFEMVKVEWDQDHWRYSGEADGWTFENHFEPLNKTNLFEALENPEAFAAHLIERAKEEGVTDEAILEAFTEKMNDVVNLIADSEGFVVLAARREQHPKEEDEQILVPYVLGGFLDKTVMMLLESQLVQLAANAHAEMTDDMIRRYKQHEEHGEEEDE